MTCFVSYLGQLDGKCIENRAWLCVEHEFQVTWLLLGHPGNSLSFCVCLCLYLYPCLSLSTLVFHVTHSIPSRTAGQGYTATKKKKAKILMVSKRKKIGILVTILWYTCFQFPSKCFHQQSTVVRNNHLISHLFLQIHLLCPPRRLLPILFKS